MLESGGPGGRVPLFGCCERWAWYVIEPERVGTTRPANDVVCVTANHADLGGRLYQPSVLELDVARQYVTLVE